MAEHKHIETEIRDALLQIRHVLERIAEALERRPQTRSVVPTLKDLKEADGGDTGRKVIEMEDDEDDGGDTGRP